MPAGSYMKLRWMVNGCVNKQGQEIKCHVFWRANRSPGDRAAGFYQGDTLKERKKKKTLCIIFSVCLCLSPSLSGASLVRHKFSLISWLANRQITGHQNEKNQTKTTSHFDSYLNV